MTSSIFKDKNYWVSAIFFVVVLIGVGLGLHSILPSIQLLGMKNILSDVGEALSGYIGGMGISFTLGSVGALGGLTLRYFFGWTTLKKFINQSLVAIMFLVIGAVFAAWYIWSFLHMIAIAHK